MIFLKCRIFHLGCFFLILFFVVVVNIPYAAFLICLSQVLCILVSSKASLQGKKGCYAKQKRISSLRVQDTKNCLKFPLFPLAEQTLEFLKMSVWIKSCLGTLLHAPFGRTVKCAPGSTYAFQGKARCWLGILHIRKQTRDTLIVQPRRKIYTCVYI